MEYASALSKVARALPREHPRRREVFAHAVAAAEAAGATGDVAALHYAAGRQSSAAAKRPTSGWDSLTRTEADVVDLLLGGRTNRAIGEQLGISRRTVETHLAHVFSKLGLSTRVELAAEAARRGANSRR
jgi:DNA-binding CsgD family transcriptional regulator